MPRSRLPPILAATIATLPRQPPFSAEQRETFFAMLHCAINAAYGRVERVPFPTNAQYCTDATLPPGVTELIAKNLLPSLASLAPVVQPEPLPVEFPGSRRYIIDHDGFAMCDGKPVKFTEAPPGTVFQDKRTDDTGNTATILWHDCGTRLDGAMPPGVTLHF